MKAMPYTVERRPTLPSVVEEKLLYGLMIEFGEHDQLLEAAKRAYAAGYRECCQAERYFW